MADGNILSDFGINILEEEIDDVIFQTNEFLTDATFTGSQGPFWWLPLPILQNTVLTVVNQPLANSYLVIQDQRGTTHFPTIVPQMWLLQTVLTSNGLVCENWVLNFVLRSVGHFQKRELAIEPKICHPYCPILGLVNV